MKSELLSGAWQDSDLGGLAQLLAARASGLQALRLPTMHPICESSGQARVNQIKIFGI